MKYVIIYFIFLVVLVFCCINLVEKHFKVVDTSYRLMELKSHVKREKERLQELKVERAKLLVPSYLDNAAGRGEYVIPRTEQIIILTPEED